MLQTQVSTVNAHITADEQTKTTNNKNTHTSMQNANAYINIVLVLLVAAPARPVCN